MIVEIDPEGNTAAASEPARKKRGGGPRTAEGRDRCRRNAMKHAMRAKVLLPEDLVEVIEQRKEQFFGQFEPTTPFEEFLVTEMAVASAWIDRCQTLQIGDLNRSIDRAVLCWDKDRRLLVEKLALRLPSAPAQVAEALEGTTQGAEWKIDRWSSLERIATARGTWDEAQRTLAFDMLGVPHELRAENDLMPADGDAVGLIVLAAGEVERLRREQEEVLDEVDQEEREMTTAGMGVSEDATSARFRRCLSSHRRALSWAMTQLHKLRGVSGKKLATPKGAGERPATVTPASGPEVDKPARRSRPMTSGGLTEAEERELAMLKAECAEEEAKVRAGFEAFQAARAAAAAAKVTPVSVEATVAKAVPAAIADEAVATPRATPKAHAVPPARAASMGLGGCPTLNRRERRAQKAEARKASR